jgi:hypothetical protein
MSDVQADVKQVVEQSAEKVEQTATAVAEGAAVVQTGAAAVAETAEAVKGTVANAVDEVAADVHPAEGFLASIEAMMLTYGGDVGTMVRNLVGKIRAVL